MDDQLLLRYSRHLMLPQLDYAGQQRLRDARVLLVGLGGLGSPVAMYLAASGIGHLALVDYDRVELSNLQRQIVHTNDAIGMAKVTSAARTLERLNPDVTFTLFERALDEAFLDEQVPLADAVVDATDNFATRFALNAACARARKPLISGAAIRFEGQVTVFRLDRDDGPCYRCLYQESGELAETCSQTGVLAPVCGIVGAVQATETIKVLAGMGQDLGGRLLLLDAFNMEWRTVRLRQDPECPVCRSRRAH